MSQEIKKAADPTEPYRTALRLCVQSLDQILPHLKYAPVDVGLLNEALTRARPLIQPKP